MGRRFISAATEIVMKPAIVLAALAFGLTLAVPAGAAPHRRAKAHVAAEPHIACTVLGCIPVPPQCGQTYGRTKRGTPTGYDVIVCPPGVWPLK
jgi:hypothetical protein